MIRLSKMDGEVLGLYAAIMIVAVVFGLVAQARGAETHGLWMEIAGSVVFTLALVWYKRRT